MKAFIFVQPTRRHQRPWSVQLGGNREFIKGTNDFDGAIGLSADERLNQLRIYRG